MFHKIGVFLLFCIIVPKYLSSNNTIISGYIISQKTKLPISGCSIFNYTQNIGTMSDRDGYFHISGVNTNQIQIRFLGYEVYELDSSEMEDTLFIELRTKIRELRTVSIRNAINPRNSLIYNPEYDKRDKNREVRQVHRLEEYTGFFNFISSPITALYYSFSPKAQRKLWAIEKLEKKRIADLRYNNEFIGLILNTSEEEIILEARRHCNFDEDFILSSTFYELGAALNSCYKNQLIRNEINQHRITSQPLMETDEY